MRLILAVVGVGLTSAAADPGVCQNTGTVSCSVNKAQCCNVVPPPFVLGCAATCCEVLANEAGPGECPDKSKFFNAVDCECAAEETDGPTAEPTPGPTAAPAPICQDSRGSCTVPNKNACCNRSSRFIQSGCAGACCTFLANEDGFGSGCPNFNDPNVPGLVDTHPNHMAGCMCAAEETDGPTAEPTPGPTPLTPALTPCRPCTTKTDCDESEICDGPSARRGLRFGIQQEGCCRGAR